MSKVFGLDVETSGSQHTGDDDAITREALTRGSLRSVQIYNPEKDRATVFHFFQGWKPLDYIQFYHADLTDIDNPVISSGGTTTVKVVIDLLSNPDHGFITHSGYFDHFVILRDLGVSTKIVGDSWILSYMKACPLSEKHSLQGQMSLYFPGYDKGLFGSWESMDWDTSQLSHQHIAYGARDAKAGYMLERAIRETGAANQIYQLELDLIPILSDMRLRGIRVDKEIFNSKVNQYELEVKNAVESLSAKRGKPVRPHARQDIADWLFKERGNKAILHTAGGKKGIKKPSTAREALEKLDDPLVDEILEAKDSQSNLSSIRSVQKSELGFHRDGSVYFMPEFRPIAHSQGGRIYTSDPSVNQWTWPIRDAVIPVADGNKFYYADISGFEWMLLAYASGQSDLISDYQSGVDIHTRTASTKIFFCDERDVTPQQREMTKTCAYATIYGSEGESVARKFHMTVEEARKLVQRIMEGNPRIDALRRQVHQRVLDKGISITPFGRIRRIGDAFSEHKGLRDSACRQAFSFYAQSGAADIIKRSLRTLYRTLPTGCKLVFTVFDSVLIEIPDDSLKTQIDQLFMDALRVKTSSGDWIFRIDSGVGNSWYEAKQNSTKVQLTNV